MYKLIRRISSSFFPRADRPWGEDATSTAPQIGRKRRHSSTEPEDDEPSTSAPKRHKADTIEPESDAPRRDDGEGVKEVTKGVQEVEIEEGKKTDTPDTQASDVPAAAAIPLPDSPVLEAQQETAQPEPEVVAAATAASEGEVAAEDDAAQEDAEGEPEAASEDAVLVNGVHEDTEKESVNAVPAPEEAPVVSTDETPAPEKEAVVPVIVEEVLQKEVMPKKISADDSIQAY